MDITYIPMRRGFLYLAAVVDWASRRVLAWRLSISPTTDFCIEALEEALAKYGRPEIFNTDQGSQFTSSDFTDVLKEHGMRSAWTARAAGATTSSSSGWGRPSSMKRYICMPTRPAKVSLARYIAFYDERRPHRALDRATPDDVYFNALPVPLAA